MWHWRSVSVSHSGHARNLSPPAPWLKHPFLGTGKSPVQFWPQNRGCVAQGLQLSSESRVFPAFREEVWASPPPSPVRKEQGPPPGPGAPAAPLCPLFSPPPTRPQPFPLVSMGTKRQPPVPRRRQFPRQLATARNWLGLKFSGYQGRGLGMEGWGSCVFFLKTPALPATCPPQGLAVMERVVATTTSMRSTEKGLNCLSDRRMNSCLRR